MTFDYAKSKATATRLIAKFGQAGKISRTSGGTGDPWNPSTPTTTEYDATFAVLEWDQKDIDGTLVKQGDRKIVLSATGLAIVPTTTDKIVIGGTPHVIGHVKPLAPGGTVVLFELSARV